MEKVLQSYAYVGPLKIVIRVILKEQFHGSLQILSEWKEPCPMFENLRYELAMSSCPKAVP